MNFDVSLLFGILPELARGLLTTLFVTTIAFTLASLTGLALALCSHSKAGMLQRTTLMVGSVARSIPELVAIFWAYYCLPNVVGLQLSGEVCGALALGAIGAGYMSEIVRGGIMAVPTGDWEAATALALPRWRILMRIVLPQALSRMRPAILNYFTDVMKNSTLLAGIGVADVAYAAYLSGAQDFRYLEPLTGVAILFFLVVFPLSQLSRRLSAAEAIVTRSL